MALLLHPNGFIQYDLPLTGHRLHVWAPDLPVAQKVYTPIHDHAFDFESHIILGRLVHTEYEFVGVRTGRGSDFSEGEHVQVFHAFNEILNASGLYGLTRKSTVITFGESDRYAFPTGAFHTSEGVADLTATVMHKTRIYPTIMPSVLIPVGVEPDNEFTRDQYPAKTLWPWVLKVIQQAHPADVKRYFG